MWAAAAAESSSSLTTIILAVIGAGAVTALITGWLNRNKVGRDTEQVAVTTATGLVKAVREEMAIRGAEHARDISAVKSEMGVLRERLAVAENKASVAEGRADRMVARVEQLEATLVGAGITVPPWRSARAR